MRRANDDQSRRRLPQPGLINLKKLVADGREKHQFHDDRHCDQQQDRDANRHF